MRNAISCLLSFFMLTGLALPVAAHDLESDLLPAEQAFIFQAKVSPELGIELNWAIAPGYYLYQDQIQIHDINDKTLISKNNLPDGTTISDHVLGDGVMYADNLDITIPWQEDFIGSSLQIRYQGCAATGFCYAPIDKNVYINSSSSLDILDGEPKPIVKRSITESSIDQLSNTIRTNYLPVTMIVFFMLGLLLSFSPCVLPMIPLVVNLIVGCKSMSAHKSFFLAGSYVLGMAGSYAVAGTLAGMLGARLQAWLQQPMILITFAAVLVLLGLAQLNLIKISIPTFNRHLHHWGQKQLQGSLVGAFILGIISSLLISPCITPPLIGVLTYIGQNGNPAIGGLTLFSLGLGMGVPLIIVAMLSGSILPKAGRWMNIIKLFTAVTLFGLALWIISPLVFQSTSTQWTNINNSTELKTYLSKANAQQKPIIIEAYADWCASCRKIERTLLNDPAIKQQLSKYILLRINLTSITIDENELLEKLKIYGPPTFIFYDSNGVEIVEKRIVGNISREEFIKNLE